MESETIPTATIPRHLPTYQVPSSKWWDALRPVHASMVPVGSSSTQFRKSRQNAYRTRWKTFETNVKQNANKKLDVLHQMRGLEKSNYFIWQSSANSSRLAKHRRENALLVLVEYALCREHASMVPVEPSSTWFRKPRQQLIEPNGKPKKEHL